jgi:DNA-binding beta-propeller fold protein YncE
MSANTENGLKLTALTTLTIFALAIPTIAQAAPVKQILTASLGAKVDATTGGNLCTVLSGDTCQPAKESGNPGGFSLPYGIASAATGNLYVADNNNRRVQEISPTGTFVLMFGKGVNKKGGDLCTAAEESECQAGIEGHGPGEFTEPSSVTVDQSTGNVYVLDLRNWRVQVFTASGEFLLMLGRKVNATTESDICTEVEISLGAQCGSGIQNAVGGTEHAAFNPAQAQGNLLAVGGPEDTLYVGDEHRVQEFDAGTGAWRREIALTSISSAPNSQVIAMAIDNAGDTYVAYRVEGVANVIRKYNASGQPILEIPARSSKKTGAAIRVTALALDSNGRLAAAENEESGQQYGTLYNGDTGHPITEFDVSGVSSLSFSETGDLYATVDVKHEIMAYEPVPVAELATEAPECKAGALLGTDATIDCTLNGLVNPEEVPETEAWFQWGKTTALEFETPKQLVVEIVPGEVTLIKAPIGGLRPNTTYYNRVDAYDHNVKPPELLTSETASFATPAVPPLILGEPDASFVKASSAVLFDELNPENAQTEYFFEYGPPEALEACPGVRSTSCPNVASTIALTSSVYGEIGATLEAQGLLPSTEYGFRLAAVSENSAKTKKFETIGAEEGIFETAPAPKVSAFSGLAEAITSTTAVVTGTVNPDGQPATYAFELGVYKGEATQYGVVFSGPTGSGSALVARSLFLTGLQPGTGYAFRIKIEGGYGAAIGEAVLFTTLGAPEILKALPTPAMLPIPPISFPKEPTSHPCRHGYVRDKHGKCVRRKTKRKARGKGARGKSKKRN